LPLLDPLYLRLGMVLLTKRRALGDDEKNDQGFAQESCWGYVE
jgi:hypothetical protein